MRWSILVVDDQPAVAEVVRRVLEREGHRVTVATRPLDALGVFTERGSDFDLVISDLVMPDLQGPALIARMMELRPVPRVLFMSGHADADTLATSGNHPILAKPFTPDELCQAIVRLALRGSPTPER